MRVPTYEQRVVRIEKPGDEDRELRRAKAYVMRLRREVNKVFNPQQREVIQANLQAAEQVLRKMRQNIFNLAQKSE